MTIKFSVQTSAIDQAIPDSAGKFVPCNFLNDYRDEYAAFEDIGIVGAEAALCLAGAPISAECPFFVMLTVEDSDSNLSGPPVSLTAAAVLLRRPWGTVGLWFAMFDGLSETHDEALSFAIEEALEGNLVGSPTIDVFQISEPERITLQ